MPYENKGDKRRRDRDRRQSKTRADQDIAPLLWPIKNPARRKKGLASFRAFCELYFPLRFNKPWSADHLRVIERLETAMRVGGLFAYAMPRGTGKTSLVEVACIFAAIAGLHAFVLLVGADKASAVEMLTSIKSELEENDALGDDFPREVGPFVLLEGEPRAATGQRYSADRTHIGWKANEIIFATVPKSKASGAVIRTAGITGRIRGAQFTCPDGRKIRPSLIIPDDPQTDKSACSIRQSERREQILNGAIRFLGAAGSKVAVMMPCTVIRRGDLADRYLTPGLHPEWHGERGKMLYGMPASVELWDQYAKIFRESRLAGNDGDGAREFYRAHRAEMDAGAVAGWEHNFEPDELSAVEHAMKIYYFNRDAFFAECQNEPREEAQGKGKLNAEEVAKRCNGLARGVVPQRAEKLVAGIDVHDEILYYTVAAWEPNFAFGYWIDYGTWPEQPDRYFAQDNPPLPLSRFYRDQSKEGRIYAGLEALCRKLLNPWTREDGAAVAIDLLLIDAGYKPEIVGKAIQALGQGNRIMPSKGFGFSPTRKPFTHYKPEPGQRLGRHWRIAALPSIKMLAVEIDTNRWKSFVRDRMVAPLGELSNISLYGTRPEEHKLLGQHFAAEVAIPCRGPWGEMEDWRLPPDRPDNHWGDNAVQIAAAASVLNMQMAEWQQAAIAVAPRKRPKVSYF